MPAIYTPCAEPGCPLYVERPDDAPYCPDHRWVKDVPLPGDPSPKPVVGRWVDDLADADHLHDGDHVERVRRRIEDVLARLPKVP